MPSLNIFKRRSSGSNALDSGSPVEPPAGTSSFRVLERPAPSQTFHGAPPKSVKSGRTFQSPLDQIRGKSADDLNLSVNRSVDGQRLLEANEALKRDRGSAGTTNSGSSGYYESSSASARHSSTSTLPSSVDQDRDQDHDDLYPRKVRTTPMPQTSTAHASKDLPPPPSFKARAARTFSFSPKHNRSQSIQHDTPVLPAPTASQPESPVASHSPQRDRSTTTSSYASTAKPQDREQDYSLGMTNFGDDFANDDFGNMFAGVGKNANRSREELRMPPAPTVFHRTESEPMYPPRALSRQAVTPSPNATRGARDNSPYSFEGRDSQDGLMASSALSSPRLFEEPPPVPFHGNGIAPAFLGKGKAGYALVPERNPSPGLERTSSDSPVDYASDTDRAKEQGFNNRQTQLDDGDRWGNKIDLRAPQLQSNGGSVSNKSFTTTATSSSGATDRTLRAPAQATAGAARLGAVSPTSEEGGSLFGNESISTTPRPAKLSMNLRDESLFDSSPQGPPSRAVRPGHQRTESGTPRKMTKAQFDALQRSGESSLDHSEDETHEDEEYDDGDDAERAKQIARQRRKQEATMAIYRQKMKKSTAGGPSDLPMAGRPSMDRAAASAPVMHMGGIGGPPPADALRGKPSDDEDEDVPLGVLQAHGFPSSSRPPTRLGESEAQRRISVAGSVAGGGAGQGNLPPFARRLPQDPYFGSSLVNPSQRESLAFSSAQSAYGGPSQMQQPQMAHPGGLVGVIASEERAKASRRGSPNPITGGYGMPMPQQMPQPQPGMPRTMSMGSMVAPSVYTPSGYMPGMPPMPGMPQMMPGMPGMPQMMMPQQDQNGQQMQQFMQMQMQLMQNVLAMQQQQLGQGTPQAQMPAQDYLGVPLGQQRPMSMASQAPTYQQNGLANQGRAMTMMNPPPNWGAPQRHTSPGYAPSAMGMDGPGGGYTPSIAPSERSNVGMPSRYRPVATGNDTAAGRSQSMTSSMTLQAFTNQQGNQNLRPESRQAQQQKSTIRLIDKPKGSPKITSRPAGDEDEDEGWAEMAKKRTEKKFGWRKKDNKAAQEQSLSDLYSSYE
ncbi:hypothetical protein LTR17_005304 [Elasticomyces elasticus]|nr:hypothetical protein LTR17_005304 [Elasticomyces elasticus]